MPGVLCQHTKRFERLEAQGNLNTIPEQPSLGSIQRDGSQSIDAGAAGNKRSLPWFIANRPPTGSAAYNRNVFGTHSPPRLISSCSSARGWNSTQPSLKSGRPRALSRDGGSASRV